MVEHLCFCVVPMVEQKIVQMSVFRQISHICQNKFDKPKLTPIVIINTIYSTKCSFLFSLIQLFYPIFYFNQFQHNVLQFSYYYKVYLQNHEHVDIFIKIHANSGNSDCLV